MLSSLHAFLLRCTLLLAILFIAGLTSRSFADNAPKEDLGLNFYGYEQLNGVTLFHITVPGHPGVEKAKKTGDLLGWGGYTIGAFQKIIEPEIDPKTGKTFMVDHSTLELVRGQTRLILPFRSIVMVPSY